MFLVFALTQAAQEWRHLETPERKNREAQETIARGPGPSPLMGSSPLQTELFDLVVKTVVVSAQLNKQRGARMRQRRDLYAARPPRVDPCTAGRVLQAAYSQWCCLEYSCSGHCHLWRQDVPGYAAVRQGASARLPGKRAYSVVRLRRVPTGRFYTGRRIG